MKAPLTFVDELPAKAKLTARDLARELGPDDDLFPRRLADRPLVFRVAGDCPGCGQAWSFPGTWLGVMELDVRHVAEPYHEPPGRPPGAVCGGPVRIALELRHRSARGKGPAYRRVLSNGVAGRAEHIGLRMLEHVQAARP